MLPYTHFIFALFLSSILLKIGYFTLFDLVLVALIAMFIDIDHLITCYNKYDTLNIRICWHQALTGKAGLRSIIHQKEGVVIILAGLILLTMWKHKWAAILTVAYFSHIFLDNIVSSKKIRTSYITSFASYETVLNAILIFLIVLTIII